jgi:hypothetical protein
MYASVVLTTIFLGVIAIVLTRYGMRHWQDSDHNAHRVGERGTPGPRGEPPGE